MRARLLVLASLVSLPLTAHADAGKAWTTAKAALPADTAAIVSANVSAMTKSPLFAAVLPVLLKKKPDLASALDDMKRVCKLDMLSVVQGVVFALDADNGKGAIYASVTGVDQPKVAACLQAIAKDKKGPDVTFTKTGNVIEAVADKQKIYYGWAASDVIVVALDVHDRAELDKWMGGKGAISKGLVGPVLAKAATGATIWGASGVEKAADPMLPMKLGYASVKLAGGNVALEFHAGMKTKKDATDGAAKANQGVTELKPNLPDGIKDLLNKLTISAVNDEVVMKFSASEKDLLVLTPILGML